MSTSCTNTGTLFTWGDTTMELFSVEETASSCPNAVFTEICGLTEEQFETLINFLINFAQQTASLICDAFEILQHVYEFLARIVRLFKSAISMKKHYH